jgi:tetratricopeptide (TPR) repeat protein
LLPQNHAFLGFAYHCLGELEKARSHFQKAVETGNPFVLPLFYYGLSTVLLDLGEIESARQKAENGLKLAQKYRVHGWEGVLWIVLGRAMGKAESENLSKAEELILKGIMILDGLKQETYASMGHFYLGEHYAEKGQREKAVRSFKQAETMFQEIGMWGHLARTQEVLKRM